MSTSSSPALEYKPDTNIQPFRYADAGGARLSGIVSTPGVSAGALDEPAERERLVREEGAREGEGRARAFFAEQVEKMRRGVQNALADFASERAHYFERVEAEIVQLALSIAGKVLHREAQVDPLLLAGIVRVALDKIEDGTNASLKVHPQQVAEWNTFFATHTVAGSPPEVITDPALPPDSCVLQCGLGTAQFGLEVQLKEIEQGLMDLMAQRPRAT
jgi:flagellar assembly protein FliH